MASFNKVIIIGNISTEIELKQTTNGKSVCSFNVAVNRNRLGSEEPKADFFTVVAWAQKAEFVSKYFSKGKPILVCGRLENRDWTDKNGNKRISTEIIAEEVAFVGGANDTATDAKPQPSTYMPSAYQTSAQPQFEEIPNDGDLPF